MGLGVSFFGLDWWSDHQDFGRKRLKFGRVDQAGTGLEQRARLG
jgi:hypothetical protein